MEYTFKEALLRAMKYCAYQERCQSEVREMLYSKGYYKDIVEAVIAELISENFLNELRFAQLFAGGKFRMKSWGRRKIREKLLEKRVSEQCIAEGFKEIKDEDYLFTLQRLIAKRWEYETKIELKEKTSMIRYLRSKGFEDDLIYKEIKRYS
ncbi:MAG: RecX family transcriptional regulator [Flavobacteriales bacterium]|nr:RecX family transcriptional regulator [Flavobacteriales bacterium]